ncbi:MULTISPECIES: hypothetical protein [Gordonia]|uniref:Uncharacterized protein n=1 Tax=Gordonia cholesterolivorans TaxID=559625 RepID=A0ABP5V0K7_9ACTN|nr:MULTISPECIES: hypothetical protein [Gordonia]WFN92959.1 hypothetical protein P5P27_19865 [Gordonia sihwensis]
MAGQARSALDRPAEDTSRLDLHIGQQCAATAATIAAIIVAIVLVVLI